MSITHHYVTAFDGLNLHYSETGGSNGGLPVICLPGVSRPAGDFDILAQMLAKGDIGPARRVLALDYRGRGLSDWDKNPENYSVAIEHRDMRTVLNAAGVTKAIFIGTSRGGIQTMFTAAQMPEMVHAAVLNDIGPVIEMDGLMRIKDYVGKFPKVSTWDDIVKILKIGMAEHFPALSDAEFETYARITFVEKADGIVMRYDPAVANTFATASYENPLPAIWPLYEALGTIPLLIIRGSTSDLLSPATVAEMMARHPGAEFYEIEGQGHAPLLLDGPSCKRIAEFVAKLPY
eukprot:gene12590-12680_t